jgi:hypothetical protein
MGTTKLRNENETKRNETCDTLFRFVSSFFVPFRCISFRFVILHFVSFLHFSLYFVSFRFVSFSFHNTVIFQKEKKGGYIYKSLVCKTPTVKVDRNKNVTLNICS